MKKLILAVILTATFSLAQGQKMSTQKQINGQFETDQKTQTTKITFQADVLLEELWGKDLFVQWLMPQNGVKIKAKIVKCEKVDGKIFAELGVIEEQKMLISKIGNGPVLITF